MRESTVAQENTLRLFADEANTIRSVPHLVGVASESCGINIYASAVTPLHSAALLAECAKLEPRSRQTKTKYI